MQEQVEASVDKLGDIAAKSVVDKKKYIIALSASILAYVFALFGVAPLANILGMESDFILITVAILILTALLGLQVKVLHAAWKQNNPEGQA